MISNGFRLNIKRCVDKSAGEYKGELECDSYDNRFGNVQSIKAEIDVYYSGEGRGVMAIDDFLFHSLSDMANKQRVILDSAATALYDSFNTRMDGIEDDLGISFDKLAGPDDVWKFAKFKFCKLRSRSIVSEEQIDRMLEKVQNMTREDLEGDKPDSISYYALVFDCKWDDEHQVEIEFIDGECTGFYLE